MTYPTSSDVSSGQPTASAHYNTLRSDALRFGMLEADGLNCGDLLWKHDVNLSIEYLATNRVRVPASSGEPVKLVITGAIVAATSNVDLPSGSAPTGAAAWWYIFAVRQAGHTDFTLETNTSPTAGALSRLIGRFWWDGSNIQQLQTEAEVTLADLGIANTVVAQGRLTLTATLPVTWSDVTAATEVFYTPYYGNWISLYQAGGMWHPIQFTETYIPLAALDADTNYDAFGYDNSGVLALEATAWTDATTRATSLVLQDGIYCKSGDLTRRYLGTFRTTSTAGQCEDSGHKRYVWNYLNQVKRELHVVDQTSHTYATVAYRPWNNDQAIRFSFVLGLDTAFFSGVNFAATNANSTNDVYVGGFDSITEGFKEYGFAFGGSNTYSATHAGYTLYPIAPGYHYMQVMERNGNGTYQTTFLEVFSTGEFLA